VQGEVGKEGRVMASIIARTADVLVAVEEAIKHIEDYRKEALDSIVAEKLAEKVRFTSIPKYANREEAIEALKKEQDFFCNRYMTVQYLGYETMSGLKRLRAMCKVAGVIRLDNKDFDLVSGYLKKGA